MFENKNNKIIIFLTIVFILDFIYFYQKLIFLAPNQNLNFWSYSAKVASEIIVKEKSNYDYIIVSDRIDSIEFAYPVYAVVDPKLVISENKKRTGLKGQNFKKLDNVYIGPIEAASVDQLITSLEGNILYIGPKEDAGKITDYQTVEYKGKGQLTTKNVSN